MLLDGHSVIKSNHVACDWFYDLAPGVPPPPDHPDRAAHDKAVTLFQSALGKFIYLSNAYSQVMSPVNALCGTMSSPSCDVSVGNPIHNTLRGLRHVTAHTVSFPRPKVFCVRGNYGLSYTGPMLNPFIAGQRSYRLSFWSDASPKGRSVTGFVVMCSGGVLFEISQRQHLVTPEPTSSEVVAAGTCVNYGIPINDVFQEISVRLGEPTPFWLDSQSTLLMATSDVSVKRSAWISRRVDVIADAVKHNEIAPHKCGDPDMLADGDTKYIPTSKYIRMNHVKLNMDGDPPNPHKSTTVSSVATLASAPPPSPPPSPPLSACDDLEWSDGVTCACTRYHLYFCTNDFL